MLNNNVYYHGTIRKVIVAFGTLFSSIYIDRKEGDSVNGQTVQRLQVPLAYAPKEKWIVRIDSDPHLENNTYTTLPRMSFEITGYSYDATRKQSRMNKVVCGSGENTMSFAYSPVPYNIDISLYILTKTQEDAMQIVEQILPTFTPEYTLSINAIPEMNIIQDVPVVLDSISVQDDYDGDFQTRRFVTHTLNFTLKTNLYGPVSDGNIISNTSVAVNNLTANAPIAAHTSTGDVATGNITSDNWTENI